MQMLQKVVETSKGSLNNSTHRHLIMPSFTGRLQGYGVHMVRNKAAVGASGISKALIQHTTEHCLKSILIAIGMASHLLHGGFNTHLASRNVDNRIDEIEIGQLSIRAIVNNVKLMIALLMGVVDRDSPL
jgi:hypothetical protein